MASLLSGLLRAPSPYQRRRALPLPSPSQSLPLDPSSCLWIPLGQSQLSHRRCPFLGWPQSWVSSWEGGGKMPVRCR